MADSDQTPLIPLLPRRRSLPVFAAPILLSSLIIYQLRSDSFDPVPVPVPPYPLSQAPLKNSRALLGAEFIASGKLSGPEDLAYDSKEGVLYATCSDGWIKRLTLNNSAVEDWVNTGGRPLGIALAHNRDGVAIVADAYKGLLRIDSSGEIEVLTVDAGGVKFKLTDGVDVARDGTVYFTDASSKYDLPDSEFDMIEGKPNGRLLSFDPVSRVTSVLLSDLRFPNGVAVSPDQNFLVFCETPLARCRKYYVRGDKKGTSETFVERLPGWPDNIHYHDGHYIIGFPTEYTRVLKLMMQYPAIRKVALMMMKYGMKLSAVKNGGVFLVDVEGNAVAHYCDPGMKIITGGIFIGDYLYFASLHAPHIVRLDVVKHPCVSTAAAATVGV